ncbi:MAG: hypothetical protein GC149_10675 [Gammaproteobacteria bacterium]|nr:hypothetical protein [Gammaproteobacteria bacterium]
MISRRRAYWLLCLLCCLCLTQNSFAASYSVSSDTYNWIDPATHTDALWTAVSGGPANECSGPSAAVDDDITQALNLGFTFNFAGTNFTSVRIQSNGRLQFVSTFCGYGTQSNGNPRTYPYPMPDSRLTYTMRVYGADIDPSLGSGRVSYASLGTAPNRYFVVTWTNVKEWSAGSSLFNLQVILYENGSFKYQFGSISNPANGHAQIGWEASIDDYAMYPYSDVTALQNTAIRFSAHTPAPLAYYNLDEQQWSNSAGEIRDSSGNGHNGTAIGSAQTVNPGYVCRGGRISGNNQAIDTGVNVTNTLGPRGTITFWFNSASNWSSGNAMLADASRNLGNGNADKFFFLSKESGGNLNFVLEDSNDTSVTVTTGNNNYASGTWHHIAITWDLYESADYLQIYIDGNRIATSRGDTTAPLNIQDALGSLNSLYFGGNRDNGLGGGGYTNSAGDGTYDEIYLFKEVLSSTEITNNLNATHACLLGQWNMDQSGWNGTTNEVVDSSGNGHDGTAMNGATTSTMSPAKPGSPGTCAYGTFDGNNDYVALNNFPNLTESFTITAWIRPNRISGDQRIFADDEHNSGGYALSLGDGGDGRLRFFSRNANPVSLDSGAVISAGTWYHIAAVYDAVAHTRQLFVNGVAVTTAQTFTGTWGTDSGITSIGGETNNAGSEAVARWRFNGGIDEVRVFARAMDAADITTVMNDTRPCAFTFDHLQIEHDGTALTCQPETVTVRACVDANCNSEYTGDVTVTLTPSGWTGGNTQVVSGGHADFVLPHTTAGAVTLGISTPSPNPANGVQCLNTSSGLNDCTLVYHDSGFIYSVPTQTSCAASNTITVSAVRLDNTTQQCAPAFVSQTRNVNFSLAYSQPNSGTKPLNLNYGGTNYNVTTGGVSVPMTFNSSGQAAIQLTYSDAGQINLNSQYTGSAGTGDAGLVMNGSAAFVTKPAKLYVYSDDPNNACTPADPSCSAFVHAGAPFNLKIRAACADNTVTPNFQLNGLTLTHTNIAPAISQGTIAVSSFNIAAGDNGEHVISNQSVSEVGAFTFTAAVPVAGYFGEPIGDTASNTSAYIGRFTPDHFCVTNIALTNRTDSHTASGCSDTFSYLDEEFTQDSTLTAQAFGTACNGSGITTNYSGGWSRFSNPFVKATSAGNEAGKWNYAAANDPTGTPTDLSARIQVNTSTSTGSFSNGQASLTTHMKISRAGSAPAYTAETPFMSVHIGLNPVDNDNIGLAATNLTINGQTYYDGGTTALYFGRLIAENAYGSNDQNTPLDMYARTEYCNAISGSSCTNWQIKSNDSCTLYNISPPADTALGLSSANDGAGGYYQRASASTSSSVFNFNDTGSAPDYARVHVPDSFGHSAGWRLFYIGGGDGGDYTIPFRFPFNTDPTQHPYLLHQDGVASFGQFRGDDRIIYWREILE